jgi:CcmD family protein
VSNWSYVAIAYTAVWGALAVYALALARRVTQARRVAESLRNASQNDATASDTQATVCDTPRAR